MNKEELEKMRHSCAHAVAATIEKMFPGTKFGVGPVIDAGFYYDVETPEPITEEMLKKIEKQARKLMGQGHEFIREEMLIDDAIKMFKEKGQDYKVSLLKDLKERGTTKMSEEELQDVGSSVESVSVYKTGEFVDLCRGPHVESTKEIGAFKLHKLAGAYWRGDENNPQLQRVYGLCFATKEELKEHIHLLEEAKKRDHRKVGKELELFVFSELVGPGMPLYTPKGNTVRDEIVGYSRELNTRMGFGEVHTPNMNKAELFKVSGHYDKYKDDMLEVKSHYTDEDYFLKPMNCPQHTQLFDSKTRSYKDLPIRYSDFANLYRDEKPGELSGLTRLRCFSQDDGHSFCREDQIESEFESVLEAIKEALATYRLNYFVRLSLRDPDEKEKYLGDDATWDKSEAALRELLKKNNVDHVEELGEAAFYGPKMDIVAKDSLKREWQISTIQLDLNMPTRFGLKYADADGTEKTPVMIHRALVGSPERFMAILIEHYAGAFPTWLAPFQVHLLAVSEKHVDGLKELERELVGAGVRVSTDISDESVGKKIRNSVKLKVPYTVVVGDKELSGEDWTIRVRGQEEQITLAKDDFLQRVQDEIKTRSN
jgi:threonyl-tRNA synthetase